MTIGQNCNRNEDDGLQNVYEILLTMKMSRNGIWQLVL